MYCWIFDDVGNHLSAVDMLKERYPKKFAIELAYVQKLLRVERVRNGNDVASLQKLCDSVETHYRGVWKH